MLSYKRHSQKHKNIKLTNKVQNYIKKKLKEDWSPEQISGVMKKEKLAWVSHETIYQYIYHNKSCGGKLYLKLRHKNKKYRKRGVVNMLKLLQKHLLRCCNRLKLSRIQLQVTMAKSLPIMKKLLSLLMQTFISLILITPGREDSTNTLMDLFVSIYQNRLTLHRSKENRLDSFKTDSTIDQENLVDLKLLLKFFMLEFQK